MKVCGICVIALLLASQSVHAQQAEQPALEVAGSVQHPSRYTVESLQSLPTATESVSFSTGHGPVSIKVKGVPLWQILDAAGLATDPKDRDPSLRKFLVATGADGYRVVMALAEVDPKFGAGKAMVAFEQDGKPVAGAFRLIVPSDKAGGRDVNHLVRIEIDTVK